MTLRRIARLMVNYYLVLGLFTVICLCIGNDHMPGSLSKFLKSLALLDSYNGAWWYLKTYIICLLIPASILLFPVQKMGTSMGIAGCWILQVMVYLLNRLGILSSLEIGAGNFGFVMKEAENLLNVLPYFWLGAFLRKGYAIACVRKWWKDQRYASNAAIFLIGIVVFVMTNLVHKAVMVGVVSFLTFLLFNLWEKGEKIDTVFLFLGDHSTNIWLMHMFFYMYVFEGLVVKAQYPVLMFLFMLLLCCSASYIIKGMQRLIEQYVFK